MTTIGVGGVDPGDGPHRRRHADRRHPAPDAFDLGAAGHDLGGEHYALEVKGDSMINAGILDGDTVIIRNADTANSGEIVVALVDDEEATLKRFRRKGASIALEAANPAYETRIFGPDQVKVQGKLVGLIRRYWNLRRLHGQSARPSVVVVFGACRDREASAPPRARSFGCGRAARPRAARENWR